MWKLQTIDTSKPKEATSIEITARLQGDSISKDTADSVSYILIDDKKIW